MARLTAHVTRWDGAQPSRGDVEQRLRADGAQWTAWGNGPNDRYEWHEHSYRDVVWCVAGSITFHTHDGDHELGPGDHIDLDPGTPHAASVGPDGVECLEVRA
jgi:quercetin dioxygenase-like cupin family protein